MERFMFVFLLFFVLDVSVCQHSLSFWKIYATDYRRDQDSRILSKWNNVWILGFNIWNTSWTHQPSALTLPYKSQDDYALISQFQISQVGNYIITFKVSGIDKNISFMTDSPSFKSQQTSSLSNIFTFHIEYTDVGLHKFSLWLDENYVYEDFSIEMQKKSFIVELSSFVHHVSQKKLIIVTNISLADVSNIGYFAQNTKALLKYKDSNQMTLECSSNFQADKNPKNFVGYSSDTNFQSLASYYEYSVMNPNDQFYPQMSGDYIVLMIENIWVDCSVNVFISFALTVHKKYLSNFTVLQSPYIYQQFTSQIINCQLKFVYKIYEHKIYLSLKNLIPNVRWNIEALKLKQLQIQINGKICNVDSINYVSSDETQILCYNSSQITLSSQVTLFDFPQDYLINDLTKKTQVVNANWNSVCAHIERTIEHQNVTRIKYYEVNQSLVIVLDVHVYHDWNRHNIPNLIQKIEVDGNIVPKSLFHFVENDENLYIIQGVVPNVIISSSSVYCTLISGKWFEKNDHHQDLMWKSQNSKTAPLQFFMNETQIPKENNEEDQLKVSEAVYSSVLLIQNFANGAGMFLFNYLINSLVAFKDLSFLFYFVEFKYITNSHRNEISNGILLLEDQDGVIGFVNNIFGSNIKVEPPSVNSDQLQNIPVGKNYNRLWDFGYFSNFLNNNFDGLLMIAIAIVKILLIFLISRIPVRFLRRFLTPVVSIWKELLLTQFVMMSPPLFLVLTSHFKDNYPFEIQQFGQKMNMVMMISLSYICGISCFILYIIQKNKNNNNQQKQKQNSCDIDSKIMKNLKKKCTKEILVKYQMNKKIKVQNFDGSYDDDTKEKSESLKEKQQQKILDKVTKEQNLEKIVKTPFSKQFVLLIDNSMYFLIPFCVGIGSPAILVLVGTVANVGRLVLIVKRRNEFSRGQFVRQILSKSLWTAFTTVYLIYWVFEILQLECPIDSSCYSVLTTLDLAQTFLFLGGCILQIVLGLLTIIVEIFLELKKIVSKKCKKSKIQDKVQQQRNEQINSNLATVTKIQNAKKINFSNPFDIQNTNKTLKNRKYVLREKKVGLMNNFREKN